jgi:hypothetical protein
MIGRQVSGVARRASAVGLRAVLGLRDVMLAAGKAGGVGVVLHQPADAVVAFPYVGVLEHLLAHHRVLGEAGDEGFGVARVERPGIIGDQVLQAEAVLDRKFMHVVTLFSQS